MIRPLVSVVMPVYNRESFVREAIDSVLAQTYGNWELILVDDGSTDGSFQIENEYAARFPEKIRCVTHTGRVNRGISASRNLGSKTAKGEYLASLDSDDLWLPDKLERQIEIVRRHPTVGLVVGATKYWHPGQPELDKVLLPGGPRDRLIEPPELFYSMYPIGNGVAPSMNTVLLHQDAIRRFGGWEDRFRTTYEDQAMLTKVYLSERAYISSEMGDIYRQHAKSIMRTELAGNRYFRQRYLFLKWLERWMSTQQPNRTAELAMVRNALEDPKLWPYRSSLRYNLWRLLLKARQIARKVTIRSSRT